MKNLETIKNTALDTIEKEINAIKGLRNSINDDFVHCAEHLFRSKGRVIITGIGKSAIIGNKIVSTLNSTGTPSIFMHAADAIHGDLGIIMEDDTIMCISKSGETPEIKVLVPLLRSRKNILIAMVGNINSYLARQADFVIDTTVETEACPNNLAPTSSTTAQLVMGDALAVCLLKMRGFTEKDFARFHPGGSLGKRLYMKVSDLYIRNEAPKVDIEADLRTVIVEISSKRLGASIVTENGKLAGIITDGDLRRLLMKTTRLDDVRARDIMSYNPKVIDAESLVVHALDIMRQNNITQLAVMDNDEYVGVIHLHDIIKEGII
ncbi:MAG: KpsF/GutQ family sugar-phosphate isomerase [Bacteroidetes bacterium]|nr:KpsF/GutQ family sugar-phosphate isomerase [Bacteroidota bacterium]